MSNHDLPRLNIAIIGGGIAGLLAARVLREQHDVCIYERSRSAMELGAAINVGPNGVKLLETLGFDRSKVGSLSARRIMTYNHTGSLLKESSRDFKAEFGADWLFQHRADLHQEFLRLATDEHDSRLPGNAARIMYQTEIAQVDPETGILTLANGSQAQYDLVIGADGIRSMLRPTIIGLDEFNTARPSGLSAFRFTLESATIRRELGRTPEFIDRQSPVTLTMVLALDETQRTMAIYPCRNFELLNFVCIVQDAKLKHAATESWTANGDQEEMLELFRDFPPWTLELLRLADKIKLWQLRDQDPLPSYIKGRGVLIGDAAHAMTPHQGQGATQAVEDAEAFRLFLGRDATPDNVASTLCVFDSIRRPRASEIQGNTRNATVRKTADDISRFENTNWTYVSVGERLKSTRSSI